MEKKNLGVAAFLIILFTSIGYLRYGNNRDLEIVIFNISNIGDGNYIIQDNCGNYFYVMSKNYSTDPIQLLNLQFNTRIKIKIRGIELKWFKCYPEIIKIEIL